MLHSAYGMPRTTRMPHAHTHTLEGGGDVHKVPLACVAAAQSALELIKCRVCHLNWPLSGDNKSATTMSPSAYAPKVHTHTGTHCHTHNHNYYYSNAF